MTVSPAGTVNPWRDFLDALAFDEHVGLDGVASGDHRAVTNQLSQRSNRFAPTTRSACPVSIAPS